MPNWCEDKLDDEYAAWLDTLCKCNIEEDGCSCLCFSEWVEQKQINYSENYA